MAWDDVGPLECAHCTVKFNGTDRQIRAVKYEAKSAYCSATCRFAARASKTKKAKPTFGPCPTCGVFFESRRPKVYCSLPCYVASPVFKEISAEAAAKANSSRGERDAAFREKHSISCMGCGEQFYAPPRRKQKFCKTSCYRSYMADRFDRWIASPERICLPQNFDEFLAQAELPCLVDGCGWHGHNLSQHMNYTHGVPADEFKRASGFNVTTGVISSTLSDTLAVSHAENGKGLPNAPPKGARDYMTGYVSLESAEHRKKSRSMPSLGPTRTCRGCGDTFVQSTQYGRAKFCAVECRESHYAEQKRA